MVSIKRLYTIATRDRKSGKLSQKIKLFEFMDKGFLIRKVGYVDNIGEDGVKGYEGMFVSTWYSKSSRRLFYKSILLMNRNEAGEFFKVYNGDAIEEGK